MRVLLKVLLVCVCIVFSLSLKEDSFYEKARKQMMDVCWQGDLTYTITAGTEDVTYTGAFDFDFPKYYIKLNEPNQEIYSNGDYLLMLDNNELSGTIYDNTEKFEYSLIPENYKFMKSEYKDGFMHFDIDLDSQKVELWMDYDTKFLAKAKIYEADGNRTLYEFKNITSSPECPESIYFVSPNSILLSEYDLVDLRMD